MSNKKILFVASVPLHFHAFHRPYFKWLYNNGFEVHVACNGPFEDPHVNKVWNINFSRSPASLSHFKSFIKLKHIIDKNKYDLINCHTPMASVLSRFAALKARKKATKLIYTAHGFHFFKGASLPAWLVYYPLEIGLSYITDAIVCINQEDFNRIQEKGAATTNYHLIPGIGVDASRFSPVTTTEKIKLRQELGLDTDAFIAIYAAEFIKRKNHKMLIDAVQKSHPKINNLKILLAGNGNLFDETQNYVKEVGLESNFEFLGFVNNIEKYYQAADLVISTSKQEGLGLNLIEAMMCGIPPIATQDRGHCTIIDNEINGILCPQNDSSSLADALMGLYTDQEKRIRISNQAIKKANLFQIQNSLSAMTKVYNTTI